MSEHPLTTYRRTNGRMTLDAFGRVVEASAATLSRIEGGLQTPSVDLARRIVAATDRVVTLGMLLGDSCPCCGATLVGEDAAHAA